MFDKQTNRHRGKCADFVLSLLERSLRSVLRVSTKSPKVKSPNTGFQVLQVALASDTIAIGMPAESYNCRSIIRDALLSSTQFNAIALNNFRVLVITYEYHKESL